MRKFLNVIDNWTDGASVFFMSVGFLITFAHIIGRYIMRAPIYFSEELARYCFVWSCMLGAAIVNRKDEHTSVTYFMGLFPKKLQAWLYLFRAAAILVLLVVLIYYGIFLSIKMNTVLTAALEVSWSYIYMALPIGSVLMIFSTLKLIVEKIREMRTL